MIIYPARWEPADLRAGGLEAKWVQRGDVKIILARNPNASTKHQRETWWAVDHAMFCRMQQVGVLQAFDEHTALGDLFSMPV